MAQSYFGVLECILEMPGKCCCSCVMCSALGRILESEMTIKITNARMTARKKGFRGLKKRLGPDPAIMTDMSGKNCR